jgi:glucokinase
MAERTVLAGDIGGTKTTLALYDRSGALLRETTFRNSEFSGLEQVLARFLEPENTPPLRACFGIAGPVRANRVQMTNLDWLVDGDQLAQRIGAERVLLVNDLVATAAGAVVLPADSLRTLNSGSPDPMGAVGVLAPGTGLGQAFLLALDGKKIPFPTEGGHSSFAPRDQQQIELLQFLLRSRDHVSVEQVCSGLAVPDLYRFMAERFEEPAWLRQQLAAADDPTPVIVAAANAAIDGHRECEPARRALQLFVDILAAEAANLCLKVLATGGIYLGGGMPPRLLAFFDHRRFMDIFCRGVYRDMLARVPVHVVLEPKTALLGARELALGGRR